MMLAKASVRVRVGVSFTNKIRTKNWRCVKEYFLGGFCRLGYRVADWGFA
jgi:hypothetical protein